MNAGAELGIPVPSNYNGFIYQYKGNAKYGAEENSGKSVDAQEGDVLLSPPTSDSEQSEDILHVTSVSNSHFVLFFGKPLHEPVFARGPFVMHTKEALVQAFVDYSSGNFIQKT